MPYGLFALLLLTFSPGMALAGDVMFEGYYQITLGGKTVGYNIQRYEFDPKSKSFQHISFLRVKFSDQVVQESLKAKANDKFQPISYQYTSQVGDKLKSIDATFKGDIMQLAINDGSKEVRTEKHKIPKGTFLSCFLNYILMQKKLPLKEAFKYSGVAEEDGGSYWGRAMIESKTKKGDLTVLRILNSFKTDKFVANMAVVPDPDHPDQYIKGEVLSTDVPAKAIETKLVSNPSLATEGQVVPNKVLLTLFGNMPTGKVNLVAAPSQDTEKED